MNYNPSSYTGLRRLSGRGNFIRKSDANPFVYYFLTGALSEVQSKYLGFNTVEAEGILAENKKTRSSEAVLFSLFRRGTPF